jgi:thioredoxin 1
MAGNIVELNGTNFKSTVEGSAIPVLVDFWAPWCGPCRMIAPSIEELATELAGKLTVAKVNVDEAPEVATLYGVRGIPNLILFRGGKIEGQLVGAVPKESIRTLVQKAL